MFRRLPTCCGISQALFIVSVEKDKSARDLEIL
jgi:hypothetical protein